MATRLKTISYCFANSGPVITAVNTAQTIARTLYIPESTKIFVDVALTATARCGSGAATDSITRSMSLQIGSNTATTLNNTARYTQSGEHYTMLWKQDMLEQFTSFWGANTSSLPVNATNQINGAAATHVHHNGAMETHITYTYDDDVSLSPTKIKTVMIPLDCPPATITTSNVTYDTIPALDTYLPEASKTIRNIYVVIQGNGHTGANSNLHCIVGNITNTFAIDPNNLASDVFIRKYMDCDGLIGNTATTHNFQLGCSVAKNNHQQAWMVVTYEYDEATTTTIMNSLMLPIELQSPGGANNTLWARGTREFWIQEPGPITTNRVAYYAFWNQTAAIGTPLGMRIGTGAFVTTYTDTAAVLGGVNGAMVRNDAAFTLTRGRNALNYDVYRTDTEDFMTNLSGFFIVNYTSGKPAAGSCVASKTIKSTVRGYGTTVAVSNSIFSWASAIPESNYFISAIGTELLVHSNTTNTLVGILIRAEKTAAEGGPEWMPIYTDTCQTDPETGPMLNYSQMRYNFWRFANDADSSRVNPKTSRRIEVYTLGAVGITNFGWHSMDIMTTYHSITYNVAGTVANSAGGNVVLSLCRTATGEVVLKQNVAANGSFNFTWYDNTEPLFISAEGDGGKYTRSADEFAAV